MTAKIPSSTGQEMGKRARWRPHRRTIVFAIAAALVVCLLAYIIYRIQPPQNPIRIAVVVPLSGPLEHRGKEALDAVNLYFDEVNRQGGVRGRPLEVNTYDDADQPAIASAKAREVAASQALVVIGHFTSPTSLAGGKVYREASIPAITTFATVPAITAGNPKEEDRGASMAALVPRTTGTNAFPYTPRWKICRQRLTAWNTLEARRCFRLPKYREAPSWPCLPIPQAISQDFLLRK